MNIQDTTNFSLKTLKRIQISSPAITSPENLIYLLKIACQSSEHLEQIHHWIKDQGGVRQTRTHYVLRTEKNIYSPLPEAKE